MNILSRFLAVGLLAATIFGCEPSTDIAEPELTAFIPSNAKAVVSIDLTSLKTKAGNLEKVFEAAKEQEHLKQIFESAAYAYFTVIQEDDESISVLSLARLSDSKALKAHLGESINTTEGVELYALEHTVKNLTETTIEDSEETEMKVIETKETYGYVGLKDNIVMTLTSPNMKTIDKKALDVLVGFFVKPETNLISEEPLFVDVLGKNKDFSIWMSGSFKANEATIQLLPRQYKGFLENLNLEGAYTTATLDFEKGSVIADYFFQGNAEYKEKYADAAKERLESTTIDQFKISNTSLLVSSAFNPKKIRAILQETGGDKEFEELFEGNELGLTSEDLLGMINGDVVIAIGPINVMQQDADIEILIGIEDESKANSLLDLFVEKQMLEVEGGIYSYSVMGMAKLLITVKDKVIIVTKDNTFGTTLLKGEGKADVELVEHLSSSSTVFYVNPSNIPYSMLGDRDLTTQLDKIESFELIGKKGVNGTGTAVLTLKLKDKERNALVLINESVNQ
jgi:hypothetical protein